jgi:transcription elongation factor GreA-like protein
MEIKIGAMVSHVGGREWGVGKVLEITASSVMIQFSDGKNRKIAASHFTCIEPGNPDFFVPLPEVPADVKAPRTRKTAVKKK